MLISLLSVAVLAALVAAVMAGRANKGRLVWIQLMSLLLLVMGTMNVSCFFHRGYYDDRPYYYENHVRIWRDGHDDNWHHAHGDVWEEERR